MLNAERLMLQEFEGNSKYIATIINDRLSKNLNVNQIVINTHPHFGQELICSDLKNNSCYISVNELIDLFITRWKEELDFQEEIQMLKDSIIDEYNGLCNNFKSEKFSDYIREHQQKVVEMLFRCSQYDKRQIASSFCKGLMNGFEIEMICKIEEFAVQVLWTPFLCIFPVGLHQYILTTTKEIKEKEKVTVEENAMKTVEEASTKIIDHIQKNFETTLLKVTEFSTVKKLLEKIISIKEQRKLCSLFVEDIEIFNDLMIDYKTLPIEYIHIKLNLTMFMNNSIPYAYDSLEINDLNKDIDCKKFFDKIPKRLKNLVFHIQEADEKGFEALTSNLSLISFLTKVEFDFSSFKGQPDDNLLIILIKNLTNMKNLSCLNLDLRNKKIGEKLTEFMQAAQSNKKTQINFFIDQLEYNRKSKGKDGYIILLAAFLPCTVNLQLLTLNFFNGKITEKGMLALSKCLFYLNGLQSLDLDFRYSKTKISDAGIIGISSSLHELHNLSRLYLNFSQGKNSIMDEGINKIGVALSNLSNLRQLGLEFSLGLNKVTDAGIIELSNKLEKLNNLQDIYLNFSRGDNFITDCAMPALGDALKKMHESLIATLYFSSNNNPRVTIDGEKMIKSARSYKEIEFYQSE